jgi:formate dehydrogenase major subunit
MIRWLLENGKEFRDYVVEYTNASVILRDDFRDTDELDGVYSGWLDDERKYAVDSWLYRGTREKRAGGTAGGHHEAAGGHGKDRGGEASDITPQDLERDPTLEHPRCVFQVLRRHFDRYTPEMVERVCGVPRHVFLRIAETFCAASGPERTGAICYAVGWTQHSVGVQMIRSAAILQLLLGNVGRPGGGILALRGHASIQGSTDIPTLYDILPGYLPMPFFEKDSARFDQYVETHRSTSGLWHNFEAYFVSLMKAYFGDDATRANDWGFDWLPRVTGDHSHFGYWLDMADGKMEGLFVMGQNPAVGAPNARLERTALAKLDWLVVRDMVMTETATFWSASPEVERGELSPKDIATEVFFLPAAGHAEKNGSFTNTQRLLQWHEKGVDPPGDARSEAWFVYHLGRRLKAMARQDARDAGLRALTWSYPVEGAIAEPKAEEILREINGMRLADRTLLDDYTELEADGSTACGCWIYCGVTPEPGRNRARERAPKDALGHGWGFAWPGDRRILYNRASARPDGAPWSERKKLVWWDEAKGEWGGFDVPDIDSDKRPDYRPPKDATGNAALAGTKPFVLHPDGYGWLYVSTGLKDGPLPAHYEPLESPVRNAIYGRQTNPAARRKERDDNRYATSPDARYPYVLTTYRLTEHHTAGGMSRHLSHLAELQPELFCEMSPELAAQVGARHGEFVTISTPRAAIEARALVTSRLRPLFVDGRVVHQVGLPYHWGYEGRVRGDGVNDLLAISEEPNVRIMETKGLLCQVRPGRRAPEKPGANEVRP